MKTHFLCALPLAIGLALPGLAQQAPADTNQPATTSSQSSSSSQPNSANSGVSTAPEANANSDQNMSARQPLQPDTRQGFWGKMNPFARKKYVQRQLSPIRNRVNELDDLTAANSRDIKDVDSRAQQGIQQASAKASQADQHAIDAGNRAQQANQTATQASTRINTVEQVVGNIDQYKPTSETEIRFRPGQTRLSTKAEAALDEMAANLGNQKGYVIEVQGFSPSRGQAGVSTSQALANSVVRYLVEKHNVPVYRIFVMGMGNAKVAAEQTSSAQASNSSDTSAKPYHGNRVDVSVLKNNVDQLASAGTPSSQQ